MNDQPNSGSRWEPDAPAPDAPDAGATAAPSATAVEAPLAPPTDAAWTPPPVPPRRGLKDRWQTAPPSARYGAAGLGALLLLLAVGLGSFAVGRASAPDDDDGPGRFSPVGRFGDRPGGDDDRDGDRDGRFGAPQDGTVPDQGALPDQDFGTTTSWYVVPTATTGAAAA